MCCAPNRSRCAARRVKRKPRWTQPGKEAGARPGVCGTSRPWPGSSFRTNQPSSSTFGGGVVPGLLNIAIISGGSAADFVLVTGFFIFIFIFGFGFAFDFVLVFLVVFIFIFDFDFDFDFFFFDLAMIVSSVIGLRVFTPGEAAEQE